MTVPVKHSAYSRLMEARTLRPLCWGQEKPHIFKFEGHYRVSLTPYTPRKKADAAERTRRRMIAMRWADAYHWLSAMAREGRLP